MNREGWAATAFEKLPQAKDAADRALYEENRGRIRDGGFDVGLFLEADKEFAKRIGP
jgi:hypothetical protein